MGRGLLKMEKDGRDGEIDGGFVGNFFGSLPEGFVANALALTSPRDVCRLSLVCSVFRSASEWDAVWESFLPPDYQKIMAEAEDGGGSHRFGSKKELYLHLCDHPIIIDGGNKSFWLDKWSGKKCYMLAARDLSIVWGDTPRYWRWIAIPESRFVEVAELISVCWLEVHGTISTSMLSTNTCYAAYLVYKLTSGAYGFEYRPAEVTIGISGVESKTQNVFLDPEARQSLRFSQPSLARQSDRYYQRPLLRRRMGILNRVRWLGSSHPSAAGAGKDNGPKQRQDGWLEVELGEYLNEEGHEGELEMSVTEVKGGNWKGGLIIQGMEIRPKACK